MSFELTIGSVPPSDGTCDGGSDELKFLLIKLRAYESTGGLAGCLARYYARGEFPRVRCLKVRIDVVGQAKCDPMLDFVSIGCAVGKVLGEYYVAFAFDNGNTSWEVCSSSDQTQFRDGELLGQSSH